MTEQELMSLIYIRAEIGKIKDRIKELEREDGLGSVNMDGMPHSRTPGNPVERMAMARAALHEELHNMRAKAKEKELAILKYINSVDQPDIRLIMTLRFLDMKNWYDVASEWEERTGIYADRTTLAKKVKKYLQKHKN